MNLSEPRLISPMLDGFVMGDPISNHDGVRACPAMHLETDKKYIVKIISLPASTAQLDALLMSGAFSTPVEVNAFFNAGYIDFLIDIQNFLKELHINVFQFQEVSTLVNYSVFNKVLNTLSTMLH